MKAIYICQCVFTIALPSLFMWRDDRCSDFYSSCGCAGMADTASTQPLPMYTYTMHTTSISGFVRCKTLFFFQKPKRSVSLTTSSTPHLRHQSPITMNFGFSPGDIVLFGKSIAKVVDALKDEGGSQFEYRSTISQCQDVLGLMEELSQLDLSRLPASLKGKFDESMSSTQSIVSDFKKMIACYDKSMGKSCRRETR
jgi:hypothetical protein